ncbi:hypothetical protein AWW67_13255 [Roseivirga seohaensis]|uniref:Conjugative transposon TraM C-terminal domain-containing protein n=2 Tax=Roseivirga seohaensis TaxID=1914963 RepID=A0A150XKT9_9BACT|nr:hypothetical protein AWW67_13255 [Roseivirga seohaensis]
MMKTQKNDKKRRLRRLLIALPFLTLPFILLIYWALSGGIADSNALKLQDGLNTNLPEPALEEEALDKMDLYKKADRDSISKQEALRSDPYVDMDEIFDKSNANTLLTKPTGLQESDEKTSVEVEKEVEEKLSKLNAIIGRPDSIQTPSKSEPSSQAQITDTELGQDIKQLEAMMQQMNEPMAEDPEMQQIEAMLEKLLDVQHPGRVRQRLAEQYEKQRGTIFSVEPYPTDDMPIVEGYLPTETNGFYTLEDGANTTYGIGVKTKPAIKAVVHETQTLVSGATIKMRLQQEVFINGSLIPEGSLVFGQCIVEGERLRVTIESIRHEDRILPVRLEVHSLDALPGIRIPGAIARKVAKDGTGAAVQGMQMMSLDPSLEMQAASAGIETAKSFFNKKVKLIRVTVKAGHPVLLVDKNN